MVPDLRLLGSRSLCAWPIHDRDTADAVFRTSLDNAVTIGHVDQHIAFAVEEADHLQGFKEKAAPLIENTLAVLELGDNLYRPDLAASNAGVAGIFGDTEPTFQSSGLRSADMAGDAFDLCVVKSVNDDFVVRPEQSELCAEGASGATLWSVEYP